MDLAVGAKQTWVMMDLLMRPANARWSGMATPSPGLACVKRIYTDLCALECIRWPGAHRHRAGPHAYRLERSRPAIRQ